MTAPVKFLLIVNDMAWFWSHRLPLSKEILKQGWDLHLATNDAAQNSEISKLNITGHDLPTHTGSLNPLNQLKLAFSIFKTLRDVKPDIVHAITLRHAFFTGLASRLAGTKRAVFTIAGLGTFFSSDDIKIKAIRFVVVPFLKIAFGGQGRFIIFQNPDDARALVSSGAVTRDQCVVIRGSGVDMTQFPLIPEPANDVPVVLFSSRLLKAKGIGEFVHAARILKSKKISARYLVAGDRAPGNHDSIDAQQLEDWKGENIVEFLGHRSDMPRLMAESNIVTLPSYYGEGVPKVLLEAAATGRAIVTTDMPGCREAVEDGVTGILVDPKDGFALADALEKLITDADRRHGMGIAGHARIEEGFTVERVNAKTLAVYKKLLKI